MHSAFQYIKKMECFISCSLSVLCRVFNGAGKCDTPAFAFSLGNNVFTFFQVEPYSDRSYIPNLLGSKYQRITEVCILIVCNQGRTIKFTPCVLMMSHLNQDNICRLSPGRASQYQFLLHLHVFNRT